MLVLLVVLIIIAAILFRKNHAIMAIFLLLLATLFTCRFSFTPVSQVSINEGKTYLDIVEVHSMNFNEDVVRSFFENPDSVIIHQVKNFKEVKNYPEIVIFYCFEDQIKFDNATLNPTISGSGSIELARTEMSDCQKGIIIFTDGSLSKMNDEVLIPENSDRSLEGVTKITIESTPLLSQPEPDATLEILFLNKVSFGDGLEDYPDLYQAVLALESHGGGGPVTLICSDGLTIEENSWIFLGHANMSQKEPMIALEQYPKGNICSTGVGEVTRR